MTKPEEIKAAYTAARAALGDYAAYDAYAAKHRAAYIADADAEATYDAALDAAYDAYDAALDAAYDAYVVARDALDATAELKKTQESTND